MIPFTLALALLTPQTKNTWAPTSSYAPQTIEGFSVLVSEEARKHPAETKEALDLLKDNLKEIRRLVQPDHLKPLAKVKFWVEWSGPNPGPVFHPGRQWLVENNHNPEKVQCVEIGNEVNYVNWVKKQSIQPMAILHELAHAYEFMALKPDDHRINDCFEKAVASKKYEMVNYCKPPVITQRKAYALNNEHEYFAEMTEAYFGRNDFQPFNNAELRTFDPDAYKLCVDIWGKIGR